MKPAIESPPEKPAEELAPAKLQWPFGFKPTAGQSALVLFAVACLFGAPQASHRRSPGTLKRAAPDGMLSAPERFFVVRFRGGFLTIYALAGRPSFHGRSTG